MWTSTWTELLEKFKNEKLTSKTLPAQLMLEAKSSDNKYKTAR